MTKVESRMSKEAQSTNVEAAWQPVSTFVVWTSSFFRHWSLAIRHLASVTCAALLCIGVAAQQTPVASTSLPHRWVYCAINLQVDENVPRLEQLMTRAAAAGYNGVLLADFKFHVLDRVPQRYFANVKRIRQKADELKLEIIPAVMPIGYSEGILIHDPNLAEGVPVREQLLVVEGKTARIEPDPPVALDGGDFERATQNKFAGWDFQDLIGRASFQDGEVKHGGNSSLRMHSVGTAEGEAKNCRVMKSVKVSPYRQYHLSVWMKTRKFDAHSSVRLFAMGADGQVLSHSNLGVKETQDWTQHHVLFNSLEHDEVRVYCGVWGGKNGTLWLDDLAIEETAFVNLLRRPGCPLVLAPNGGGTKLIEGRDFDSLHDPKLGNVPSPGSFDVYHDPPKPGFRDVAALRDGDRLRVSYYHALTIYDGQVACCLSEPKVFELLKTEVAGVQRLLEPKGFMMSHDEIRVAGWCAACQKPKRTAGKLLAENVRRCVEIIREANPRAAIYVWSDMFDPAHNAVDKFYLVNGSWSGSWEGLSKDKNKHVTIVNWNHGNAAKSLRFFAKRGHRQILAGYYDGSPRSIADWLGTAGDSSNLDGVMYTTWRQRYDDLESFARHAWGQAAK